MLCRSLEAMQKTKKSSSFTRLYPGTKRSEKYFNHFVRRNNLCLEQKTLVLVIRCTFLVITGICTLSVLWVFSIARHLTENQLAHSKNKLTRKKILHMSYKIDQATWSCFQTLSTTCSLSLRGPRGYLAFFTLSLAYVKSLCVSLHLQNTPTGLRFDPTPGRKILYLGDSYSNR